MTDSDLHSELTALERLLDDPSEVVRAVVIARFREMGSEGLVRLRTLRESDGRMAVHAAAVLRALGDEDDPTVFLRYASQPDADLARACLLLERVVDPSVRLASIQLPIESMARRVAELIDPEMPARDICREINRVVFHEWGFLGDESVFLRPAGSFLSRVIATRRGIPISLCLIFLMVARRVGLALVPVSLPGRFMLAYRPGEYDGWFLDCYEGGVFRSRDEVKSILRDNNLPHDDRYLSGASTRLIMMRCCRNLTIQFEDSGDAEMAAIFLGFVDELEKSPH